jgi:medium-chain acyl-[acyl-carrier-protein] hydrolase
VTSHTRATPAVAGGPLFGSRVDADLALRLFCLPFAGGGASMFYAWREAAPSGVQVCPLHLAGREVRFREAPRSSMRAVVDELADTLTQHVLKPFALFGHSMGGIVAFELAREIRRRAGVEPEHLVVAASRAPQLPARSPGLASLPDDQFIEMVQRRYSGIPDAILRDAELRSLFMPVLKADLSVLETYAFREEPPLRCPLTIIGGREDHTVSESELAAWRSHTTGPFDLRILPGDHFFKERRHELLQALVPDLQSHVVRLAGPAPVERSA